MRTIGPGAKPRIGTDLMTLRVVMRIVHNQHIVPMAAVYPLTLPSPLSMAPCQVPSSTVANPGRSNDCGPSESARSGQG